MKNIFPALWIAFFCMTSFYIYFYLWDAYKVIAQEAQE